MTPDERAQELYDFLRFINFDGDCKRYGDELVFVLRRDGYAMDIRWNNGWKLKGIDAWPVDLQKDRQYVATEIATTLGGR